MSNVIKFSITGDTNAEQVTNRAKTAVSGFDKQVEGIGNKFGSAFKDIALSFIAPMVLLNNAIAMISGYVAKVKQDAQDGLDLLAKGETMYANAEEKKMANFFKAKKAREEEMAMVESGKTAITMAFLETPEGKKIADEFIKKNMGPDARSGFALRSIGEEPEIREKAMKAFLASPEGKAYKPIFDSAGKDNFKPEGLSSNVIGVGQSPGMAVIHAQLAVQQEIAEMMRKIAEKYDAKESIDRSEGTPYKRKPDYSVPAYPQFK
jgi:hypothetical protein